MARPESVLRRGATPAAPSAFTQPNRVNYTVADTFTSLHYHVVFSTKGREPWPRLDIQERVWACQGGIARQNQLRPLLIGGTEDHIHVLLGIPPTVAICGIDKASRGVQASLARRNGYGPLIPWAEATRRSSQRNWLACG